MILKEKVIENIIEGFPQTEDYDEYDYEMKVEECINKLSNLELLDEISNALEELLTKMRIEIK